MRGHLSSPRVDLASTVRADVGARQIHLALVGILEANEPGLLARLDTEFLHDFRVTVRRTRSLLGQIRRVFPAGEVEHFAAEFSWIGRLTGRPRDVDVLTPVHNSASMQRKLRYLIDITPILGSLKKLQRVLGDFNDAAVQEHRLSESGHALGAAGGSAGALLALGRRAEQSSQPGAVAMRDP